MLNQALIDELGTELGNARENWYQGFIGAYQREGFILDDLVVRYQDRMDIERLDMHSPEYEDIADAIIEVGDDVNTLLEEAEYEEEVALRLTDPKYKKRYEEKVENVEKCYQEVLEFVSSLDKKQIEGRGEIKEAIHESSLKMGYRGVSDDVMGIILDYTRLPNFHIDVPAPEYEPFNKWILYASWHYKRADMRDVTSDGYDKLTKGLTNEVEYVLDTIHGRYDDWDD